MNRERTPIPCHYVRFLRILGSLCKRSSYSLCSRETQGPSLPATGLCSAACICDFQGETPRRRSRPRYLPARTVARQRCTIPEKSTAHDCSQRALPRPGVKTTSASNLSRLMSRYPFRACVDARHFLPAFP